MPGSYPFVINSNLREQQFVPQFYERHLSFLQIEVTPETASGLVQNISSVLNNANEEDQTSDNLGRVTEVLEDVVGLITNGTFAIDENVRPGYNYRGMYSD